MIFSHWRFKEIVIQAISQDLDISFDGVQLFWSIIVNESPVTPK
jgi:hypothetical protein